MALKLKDNKICPDDFEIVSLINEFLKQRMDVYLADTSVMDSIYKKDFTIKLVAELIKSDIHQYLSSIFMQEKYYLLVDDPRHLSVYIDAIIKMWTPLINAALETRIKNIHSKYFNQEVA
jgi:hypothetical protein